MKQAVTAEQIAQWFTLGAQFANVRITEEPKNTDKTHPHGEEHEDQSPGYRSPEKDGSEGGVARKRKSDLLAGAGVAPVPLASFEYPALPITKNRQELISLIESNSVVIIRGATGSGKTTQLPQFILDYYTEKSAPCSVVVTQPRKIGASSIARWVAQQRRCTLGSLVGYQVGLEKMATEHTRLIYMTTGVLLRKLVAAKSLIEFTHIFIDEVHERTEELDFLLLMVRKLLHSNSRFVKVILMSATINCAEFAEYFGTPIRNRINPAYVFEVEGAPYTVEEFYLDDLKTILPFRVDVPLPDDPYITVEMYNVAVSLIQSFDEMETKEQSRLEQDGGTSLPERGSVLVFLPGLAEIQYMQEALAKLVRKRLQVYPLHSTVTLEEQNGVFLVPAPGYRKIILSTNIAESSVTVPDVKYVIDFCLVRHLVCDKETNYQSLRLTWASKTNCNQRRGRAGRVSKGFCYRLVTRSFWNSEIPEYTIPEMLRSPLANTLLNVKLLDMGDPRSLLSTALTPPNLDDIERTILQLKEMGALSVCSSSRKRFDGDLTFLGRVLAHLPVDLHFGKLIVLGHVFGCLEECIITAAALSLKSFFAMPSLQQLPGYRSKLSFAQGVPSDPIAFVHAFKAWYTSRAKGEFRRPKDELEWGKENCIQIKRIREVAELFEDLKNRVSQFNMHIRETSSPSDYTSKHTQKFILQVAIAGAFYPNYFLQGTVDEELASKELSGNDPRTTVLVRNLPPFAFLYYKQLQSLFRQCGQVKSISFDYSRAYVEFYRSSLRGSGVLPEVSLSLLLAQQRLPLYLHVYPAEEVETRAGGQSVSHLRYARVNVDFQNQCVSPVGVLSSSIEPEKLPSNRVFIVNITEVIEVGHFWGFQADEASLEKQRRLTAAINARELRPLPVSLYPNLLCLAPFSDTHTEPGNYYRAKILHVMGSNVEVFFVDFGNTSKVPCNSLRELPADLQALPFQAQEFSVACLAPSAQSVILGNHWSSRARNRFITLVHGRSLIVTLYSILYGVMRVHLHVSMETGDVSVADLLVQEGHARPAPESFESKQSHEVLMALYQDLKEGTFTPSSTSSSWKNRKEEEKRLIDSLLLSFSKSSHSAPKCKVPVHGPSSPHKVTFHSMNGAPHFRSVAIDRNSINSVLVNDHPHDHHDRMLVAGSVSLSASGVSILLKETTLMPQIHGLPAIITMLFTPIMELRTDEERTCFTGALCGLGSNSDSHEAVLPEHDIEMAFDVKFDVDDIAEINALREAMNRLVCEGPNGLLHLGPERISSLQDDARDRLLRLFCKAPPREDRTPVYYDKPKKWNQVDPSQQMEVVQKGDSRIKGVLFQLHPITLLNM
ncbi:ATP-dependent RNA helicase TDRD9 isoform X1 [Pangasianodon hypophthalmus]|uniref:ATP-dependent RNA helicase TDRD9 isoform X1 n=1 Tax=Pangasianodon hypophthalmus TaxID=310915 RepID=UPI0023072D08|nr:ATP-dependent RNA helicase TDRD9 isoform X1 [Pangasianodon hypophthalmus]